MIIRESNLVSVKRTNHGAPAMQMYESIVFALLPLLVLYPQCPA